MGFRQCCLKGDPLGFSFNKFERIRNSYGA
jgi:hypothetical protein